MGRAKGRWIAPEAPSLEETPSEIKPEPAYTGGIHGQLASFVYNE
jgi:hypothetical protein